MSQEAETKNQNQTPTNNPPNQATNEPKPNPPNESEKGKADDLDAIVKEEIAEKSEKLKISDDLKETLKDLPLSKQIKILKGLEKEQKEKAKAEKEKAKEKPQEGQNPAIPGMPDNSEPQGLLATNQAQPF